MVACSTATAWAQPAAAVEAVERRERIVDVAVSRYESGLQRLISNLEMRQRRLLQERERDRAELSATRQAREALEQRRRELERRGSLSGGQLREIRQEEERLSADIQRRSESLQRNEAAIRQLAREREQAAEYREGIELLASISGQEISLEDEADWLMLASAYDEMFATLSTGLGETVRVNWRSFPTGGATIYYQTRKDRDDGDPPRTLPASTNREQPIALGCFFVWAQWPDGKSTDKNRDGCFERDGITFDLQ